MKKAWGIVLLFSILLNTVSGMAAAQTDNEREFYRSAKALRKIFRQGRRAS